MKAFIIGISGQDGSYLADLLLKKGYQVFGGSRDPYRQPFANLRRLGILEHVTMKPIVLSDFRSVLQAVRDIQPTEIYNLSGQSSVALSFDLPIETFESIALGSLHLLESIRFLSAPIRLYNACSSECFGDAAGKASDEQTLFLPRSPYAVAKSAAHWHVCNYREAYGLFACSGILFNHESPLRPPQFVTQKIVTAVRRIAAGSHETLELGNLQVRRDWGWAPEYVDAMWRMLQLKEAEDFVIGTGQSHSLEEFVSYAFDLAGLNWKDHVIINPKLLRPSEISISVADPSKAFIRLNWSARYKMKDIVRFMTPDTLYPESG